MRWHTAREELAVCAAVAFGIWTLFTAARLIGLGAAKLRIWFATNCDCDAPECIACQERKWPTIVNARPERREKGRAMKRKTRLLGTVLLLVAGASLGGAVSCRSGAPASPGQIAERAEAVAAWAERGYAAANAYLASHPGGVPGLSADANAAIRKALELYPQASATLRAGIAAYRAGTAGAPDAAKRAVIDLVLTLVDWIPFVTHQHARAATPAPPEPLDVAERRREIAALRR